MMLSLILALLAGSSGQAESQSPARTRSLECRDGETIPVRVRISGPAQNILTAVTLPDLVENVVSSWNDRELSVEVQGAKLFLKLLEKAEGHLDILTTGGMHLRLDVKPSGDGEDYDGHLVVKAVPSAPPPAALQKLPDALELVKAMRLGRVPAGASVKRGGDAAVTTAGDVECRLAYVYETSAYRGYVIRLTNRAPKAAYHVDVTRFATPRLVLIGAKSLVVAPDESTFVYLVLWK